AHRESGATFLRLIDLDLLNHRACSDDLALRTRCVADLPQRDAIVIVLYRDLDQVDAEVPCSLCELKTSVRTIAAKDRHDRVLREYRCEVHAVLRAKHVHPSVTKSL